jgi:hypothetical protein
MIRAPDPTTSPAPEPASTTSAPAAPPTEDARPAALDPTVPQFAPEQRRPSGPLKWILIAVAGLCALAVAVAATYALTRTTGHSPISRGRGQSPRPGTGDRSSGSAPATVPSPGGGPDNVWIAQLASVPVTASTAHLDAVLARVQSQVPGARVLNSARYASLNPGYWVIYYQGTFTNGDQVLSYCAARGRATADQCIGRYLSHNPADHPYQCYPPAAQATGDCYHG